MFLCARSRAWAETVAHNLKPANTHPGAPLKAEVVNQATRLMADLDIETVTEIFIRVNSAGASLSQADFAMSKIAANDTYGGNMLRKAMI